MQSMQTHLFMTRLDQLLDQTTQDGRVLSMNQSTVFWGQKQLVTGFIIGEFDREVHQVRIQQTLSRHESATKAFMFDVMKLYSEVRQQIQKPSSHLMQQTQSAKI